MNKGSMAESKSHVPAILKCAFYDFYLRPRVLVLVLWLWVLVLVLVLNVWILVLFLVLKH